MTPVAPFDEIKCFALRVPRTYQQMGYGTEPLTLPGTFPSLLSDTPQRLGAPFEEGAELPTGDPSSFPASPLPRPLLTACLPLAPPPPARAAAASEGEGTEGAEVKVPAAAASAASGSVRPLAPPPLYNETCVELQFRAQVPPIVQYNIVYRSSELPSG